MSEFDEMMAEMDGVICEVLGDPATYLSNLASQPIQTQITLEKDLEIVGQFADVVETQTHGSLLVADVGQAKRGSVLMVSGGVYVIRRSITADGSIAVVEVLEDEQLKAALASIDFDKTFTESEWTQLWQTISTHKSVQ